MIHIRVPATSANLGPGFDALGVALTLYNETWLSESDRVMIEAGGPAAVEPVPDASDHMIVSSARHIYDICGRPFYGLSVKQYDSIPMTRGLGSSSACIVAGMLGANALLGDPIRREDLLSMAAHIEGHPDNIAPALRGGLVTSVMGGGRVTSVSVPVADSIRFAAMIPPFALKTSFARSILPEAVSRADAVYNLSRAALMTAALFSGDLLSLRVAVQDRLHQPYRLGLIPGGQSIMDIAMREGAYGAYISGAGPAVIAVIARENSDFSHRVERDLKEQNLSAWRTVILGCDPGGAICETQEHKELTSPETEANP